jgi:hypothetical protein
VKFWANEITRLPGNFRTGDKILILPSDSTGPLRDLLAQKAVVSPQPIPLPTSRTTCGLRDLCAMLFLFFSHASRSVANPPTPLNKSTF